MGPAVVQRRQVQRRQVRRRQVRRWGLASALLLAFSCGCAGNGNELPVYPTKGRVTYKSQPAVGVVLQLHPVSGEAQERGLLPGAVSQTDGLFEITTYRTGDGAPAGEYRIVLFWPPNASASPLDPAAARQEITQSIPSGPPDRFGGKYFDSQESKWSVTVNAGENTIETLEL